MQELRQTKEGFIKSMLLFFVLLVICFAPFFAFSQTSVPLSGTTNPDESVSINQSLLFEVKTEDNLVTLSFTTVFPCFAYTVEGRTDEGIYQPVFYCKDPGLCMDASRSITHAFRAGDYPYTCFRVQTTSMNGDVLYSREECADKGEAFSVQVVQTSVSDNILLHTKGANRYRFLVSNMNGEVMMSGNADQEEYTMDVSNLTPGMYILTVIDESGNCRHEKFFRTGL